MIKVRLQVISSDIVVKTQFSEFRFSYLALLQPCANDEQKTSMEFQSNVFSPVFTAFHRKHLEIMNEPSKCLEKDEEGALNGTQKRKLHGGSRVPGVCH